MESNWPVLKHPPVDVAMFQLIFDMGDSTLADLISQDLEIRKILPIRRENVSSEMKVPSGKITIGVAQFTATSKTRVAGYMYSSKDQKSKVEILEGRLTYVEEHPYENWNLFLENVKMYLGFFSEMLCNHKITRTSIRFINHFVLDDFDDPTKYFKTTISTTESGAVPYPVSQFAFNMLVPVSENIYSVVKQEYNIISDKNNYIFDIDVLDKSNLLFDIDTILDVLMTLREVKNKIFFGNVTNKLIDLCNLE